jgi:hypothetical protein
MPLEELVAQCRSDREFVAAFALTTDPLAGPCALEGAPAHEAEAELGNIDAKWFGIVLRLAGHGRYAEPGEQIGRSGPSLCDRSHGGSTGHPCPVAPGLDPGRAVFKLNQTGDGTIGPRRTDCDFRYFGDMEITSTSDMGHAGKQFQEESPAGRGTGGALALWESEQRRFTNTINTHSHRSALT